MVNVALVGYGYWGPNVARNLHELPNCRFQVCCDLDPARLALAQARFPQIRVTSQYSDVLSDEGIEAVVIATPARSHFALAKAALLAGKHVLVEKPLAMSSQEAEELIALADAQKRVLMVGHTFEYNPAVLKIKELLSENQLGDIYYAYSTRVNLGRVQRDLNALWSIAPHDISILLFLFEQLPSEVSARGSSHLDRSIEDVVFVDFLFPSGITAHIHVSWLDPSKVRRMTIVGSKKMVVYDDLETEGKVKVYDKGVLKVGDGQIFGEFQYRLHSGDIYIPKIDLSEPLRNECAHFLECIEQRKSPRTDGQSGLRVIRVLEAAQESLRRRGAPVQLQ
ncbi:MAG: Gfo/Idh/MocA family oxidoreductase [candidate division KSB1 bacterium]|nr:Gfo/Idh/MocA family oxidoreductase [candidate division KSB1 bacterium]